MALKVDNLSLLELEGSEEDKQSESADAIRSVVYGREGRKEGKKDHQPDQKQFAQISIKYGGVSFFFTPTPPPQQRCAQS